MNLPKVNVAKILTGLVLAALVGLVGWYVFFTKEITLVDKGNGTYARFCDKRPEVCEDAMKTYFTNVKSPLFKILNSGGEVGK